MGQPTPIHRSTVLVVEDDEDQRFLIGTLFEESGFDVLECDSAEAALELVHEQADRVALVFSDVRLNGQLDGVDLAKSIRDEAPEVPVILTSGAGGERLKHMPENTDFMQKPWRPLDLLVKAERIRSRLEAAH